ncbi:hypothetical protein O181_001261 [Austropuccinia psidii MF-1]|uniref:Uncharacterized protein n=1 Tax=Austropuccinia psidii MF-1 TaxID=1389203 RepID=A0A9Q3GC89_9BASI|nr:hypothetical protein [Austropuccinia psidii MF-1]
MVSNSKPPEITFIEQFILTYQIFKELLQWRQGIKPRVPLERTCRKYPEDFPQRDILQRTYHRREIEPDTTYSDSFRRIMSSNPSKLPSGFTPLRHQKISDQDSS